jgi:uncharacterized membrane protein
MASQHGRFTPQHLLLAALLLVGLIFRFVQLDRKVYWNDEVWTSQRLAGYSGGEVLRAIADGRELGPRDLRRYQRLAPGRGIRATLRALAADDPKQPPLYYVLLRLWAGRFGDSVKSLRCLSALISLLAFPVLFALCLELFGSRRTAWMAVALLAVSPFHVLYDQEARPYSLWALTILLASVALLRALRLGTARGWILYALTVALGLYTHALFLGVMLAHTGYVTLLAGALSCVVNAGSPAGWTKEFSAANVAVARIINRADRPLVITDTSSWNPRNVISLSYLLEPRVRLRILRPPYALGVVDGYGDVFVFHPSPALRKTLKKEAACRLELVSSEGALWRLPSYGIHIAELRGTR